MNLNKIETGQTVLIQTELGGVWIEGEIAETEGVRKKYVSLLNGDEALAKEVKKLRILK